MKQISQNYKTGKITLEGLHSPGLKPGGILVQTLFSVISAGTEGMKVKEGKMSYIDKARARPDQVKKVIQSVQQQGLASTYQKVMNKLDSLTPLGYSLSGVVTDVGADASEFVIGQRVACAGAGYANHAEVNFVPRNLAIAVPDNVSLEHASFATLGAIAMQGYRQAEMQLGESACIIGLGLIGQLLLQILKSAGIHVIGIDISDDRCQLARELGADVTGKPDDASLRRAVSRLTQKNGADVIFITAGGNGNGPVELAVEIARDRARVVDIGKTRLDLSWKDYYEKEMDVRFSRSYGPGRYDPNYEERGIDYPIGYVRWTQRRNMMSFVELLAQGSVKLDPIIHAVYPFHEAEQVYQKMADGALGGIGVLFSYPKKQAEEKRLPVFGKNGHSPRPVDDRVRIGVIGAGNYASSMLLPHLKRLDGARLVEVATATSLSGANAARKFTFERTSTDYRAILEAPDIDAVLIATRHRSHAPMAAEALCAGKAVFVEKPLAIDWTGLQEVRQALKTSPRLQVGFNRRFAPLVKEISSFFPDTTLPVVLNYRVHAGEAEAGSWYLDPEEGSRFIGEAGHFLDVFSFLTRSRPVSVTAKSLRPNKATADDFENIAVVVTYENGSIGNLLYLTQGATSVPKEFLEVFGGGRSAQLHNFESVTLFEGSRRRNIRNRRLDKGQQEEMKAFVKAVAAGEAMPIPLDSLMDTSATTLAACESLRQGTTVSIAEFWCE